MSEKEIDEAQTSKYIHLGQGYDKDWMFIKDDKELKLCITDFSIEEGDYVIEIKKVYKAGKMTLIYLEDEKSEQKSN